MNGGVGFHTRFFFFFFFFFVRGGVVGLEIEP